MLKPMSRLQSKTFTVLCVITFLFGFVIFAVSSFSQSQKNQVEPARAFRLVKIESEVDSNGTETFKALRIKEVDAQGNWRSTVHPIGKSSGVEYIRTPEGLSATKGGEQKLLGSYSSSLEIRQKARTVSFYENHPDFIGTDTIAGLKVYKLRTRLDQEGGWLELANSPLTGDIPLRIILHKPDGSEHRIETVKVEFK